MSHLALVLLEMVLFISPARAEMRGVECRAKDKTVIALDYAGKKLYGWGAYFGSQKFSSSVTPETRGVQVNYDVHAGSWFSPSTHIRIIKKQDSVVEGIIRAVKYGDGCTPEQGFSCKGAFDPQFICSEVDTVPQPPPEPPFPGANRFPVCSRTPIVKEMIEKSLRKDCKDIVFADLAAIKSVDLSGRGIVSLQDGDFYGLGFSSKTETTLWYELAFIDLSRNRLSSLPIGLFGYRTNGYGGLTDVASFDLSENEFEEVPQLISHPAAATKHDIISVSIGGGGKEPPAPRWRGLNLRSNRLRYLPQFRINLWGTLDLSRNQISRAEPNFVGRISKLDVSNNLISDEALPNFALREINVEYVLENNLFTAIDLNAFTEKGFNLSTISIGREDQIPILISGKGVDIQNLVIRHCHGSALFSPDSTFDVRRLTLERCQISLERGLGGSGRVYSIDVRDSKIVRIEADWLVKHMYFFGRDIESLGDAEWRFGKLKLSGETQLTRTDFLALSREFCSRLTLDGQVSALDDNQPLEHSIIDGGPNCKNSIHGRDTIAISVPPTANAPDKAKCFLQENDIFFCPGYPPMHLKNTKSLVSGYGFYCALSAGRVDCWGPDAKVYDAAKPSELVHVDEIAAGHRHICALAKNDIICWSPLPELNRKYSLAGLKNPSRLITGDLSTIYNNKNPIYVCIDSEKGPICWGDKDVLAAKLPAEVKKGILGWYAAENYACALLNPNSKNGREKVISCWGNQAYSSEPYEERKDINEFLRGRQALQIVNGTDETVCVRYSDRILCWSRKERPEFLLVGKTLSNIWMGNGAFCTFAPGAKKMCVSTVHLFDCLSKNRRLKDGVKCPSPLSVWR